LEARVIIHCVDISAVTPHSEIHTFISVDEIYISISLGEIQVFISLGEIPVFISLNEIINSITTLAKSLDTEKISTVFRVV
jgi:hypothetical protein